MMKPPLALLLFVSLAAPPVLAINKCVVKGKPVFQDAPCEDQGETVAQSLERQKRIDAFHRELDQLANQGYGMRREASAPPPPAPKVEAAAEPSPPKTAIQLQAEQYAAKFRQREEIEQRRAEEAARQKALLDDIAKHCKGDPKQPPKVGMGDAEFRDCTVQGRSDTATQVVAIERGGVPLRLYLFPSEPRRVYSVDGVVTAIR